MAPRGGLATLKRPASALAKTMPRKPVIKRKPAVAKIKASRSSTKKRPAKASAVRSSSSDVKTAMKRRTIADKRSVASSSGKQRRVLDLPEVKSVPVYFEFTSEALGAYGLFVDQSRCVMGDEAGLVVDVDRTTGEPTHTFRLPVGVKCVVGDGEYLYVGTNDGKIYDLTSGRPHEVAMIEGFGQIYWIDIRDGLIAASDNTGKVGLLNCEGEVLWQRTSEGIDGWLCRMDATGIYHGTSKGAFKYSLRGELLWKCGRRLDITFGIQTIDHVWVMSLAKKKQSPKLALAVKINKDSGKVESTLQMSGVDSCSVSPDGTRCFDSELNVQPANVKFSSWDDAGWKSVKVQNTAYSQQIFEDKLYMVSRNGSKSIFTCVDLSEEAIKHAAAGGLRKSRSQNWGEAERAREGTVAEEAEDATSAEGKIVICCVQDGSKVRARVESPGYDSSLNCQFPRGLREVGAKFVVDCVELAPSGDFYRCKGEPKRLRE